MLKHKASLSRLLTRLRERAAGDDTRALEQQVLEAIGEMVVVVPSAIAEDVRRRAREHRAALVRGAERMRKG